MTGDMGLNAYREIVLTLVPHYARTHIPSGVLRANAEVAVDRELDGLMVMFRGYVLGEEGGDEAVDWVTVNLPVRPRWFPRWLWRRLPCREAHWELRCQPMWMYPNSTIAVPDLGHAVKISVPRGMDHGDGNWRDR